jgi:aspartate 1-decarboxylase
MDSQMLIKLLGSKLHHLVASECDKEYVGSLTIDSDLLRAAGIRPSQAILVCNVENGARFETYAMAGDAGSGYVCVNGASARLVSKGDRLIVLAFVFVSPESADAHSAQVVTLDKQNRIIGQFTLSAAMPS